MLLEPFFHRDNLTLYKYKEIILKLARHQYLSLFYVIDGDQTIRIMLLLRTMRNLKKIRIIKEMNIIINYENLRQTGHIF